MKDKRFILGEGYLWTVDAMNVSLWESWPPASQWAKERGEYVLLDFPEGIWGETFGKVRLVIEKLDE